VKKFLAVFVGALFMLCFSAAAFAVHAPDAADEAVVAKGPTKITLGGKILVRGWYFDNVTGVSGSKEVPVDGDSHAFYSTNVNLWLDAQVSDGLRGMIEFETARGGSANSGLYYWGDQGRGYDSKPNADILVRQAWIQYVGTGLIGIPLGIKIGHMPISLGEKIFLNNERFGDDAILVWADPMKELHIAAGTVKLNEGDILSHTDDLDGYVALATFQWDKDNMVGFNYVWTHSDGNCPSNSYKVTDDDGNVKTITGSTNVDELNFSNVGVHAKGMIAGLSYAAEADFQFGEIEGYLTQPDGVDGELVPATINPKGWGVFAKLGYMIDPVNIRASFAYGSGDDEYFDDDCEEFQTQQGPDYGATARLVHYTQIYERTVRTASLLAKLSTTVDGNTTNTGIANTTYYNLGVDVNLMKDLSLSVDGFLLQASETGAWEDYLSAIAEESVSVDDDLGWEVDVKLNYKITKNLSYFVEGGYFDAGDFYKDIGAEDEGVTQVVHGLLFTF
jgi:predicted porin